MVVRLFLTFCLVLFKTYGQKDLVKIVEEKKANKILFYAVNESETDYDAKILVKGTNIKQSLAKPRFIRVPSATKVLMKSIIVMRGKTPSYTYDLELNEELSKRSLRKPAQKIIIYKTPKKPITIYVTENCKTCDSIINPLDREHYIFTSYNLKEKPEVKEQLVKSFGNRVPLDTMENPVVILGGILYTDIDSFDKLLETLNKQE
ncbi:hypothetical protein ACFQ1M_11825 [Sungkyunkwania multivorans]|uniref:Glutaredoxin n=1 Tax=Sungkyunkwania multivorans TaxID=1173618 RepID=A0ABW3D238_9FLAO